MGDGKEWRSSYLEKQNEIEIVTISTLLVKIENKCSYSDENRLYLSCMENSWVVLDQEYEFGHIQSMNDTPQQWEREKKLKKEEERNWQCFGV